MPTFAAFQPQYAEVGIATFPFSASGERKRPLIRGYGRVGLPGSATLALKFGDADGLACVAGRRSKLTIIDIDARGPEGERLLADVQREHGASPFIVRTGSGGFHVYYRHSDEPRKIRLDPTRPVDLLGGGPIVPSPSQGARNRYEIIQGTLADLAALTPMRMREIEAGGTAPSSVDLRHVSIGQRDAHLWPIIAKLARQAETLDALLIEASALNATLQTPLPDHQIVSTCRYWWRKTEQGENFIGSGGGLVVIPHARIDDLMMNDPDGFLLLTFLQRMHWGREFVLANETSTIMPEGGWTRKRFAAARERLIEAGYLIIVRQTNGHRPMTCAIASQVSMSTKVSRGLGGGC
jgi:bifunctional DNA primase/polymerase-like protein